jgi:hypothetical protein
VRIKVEHFFIVLSLTLSEGEVIATLLPNLSIMFTYYTRALAPLSFGEGLGVRPDEKY